MKYLKQQTFSREKFKVGWRFSTIRQMEAICSTRKSSNVLFCSPSSSQASYIAFLGYTLICQIFLHHMMSNFSRKCKHCGFWEILPLVQNPAFCSFAKTVIQLWTSLQQKVFDVNTSNFGNVLNHYPAVLYHLFILIEGKLQ